MKYTTSKEADKKIQEDIEVITKIILKYWKPKAIVMFGGFGHGGGSFKKIGKKIIPLNDYDLYLITDKTISGERLEKVGEECSKALGKGGKEIVENYEEKWDEEEFFHVDLHNVICKKLKSLYPTQRTMDLKTSIIVYGNKNILNQIPEVEISKSDAIRLLFNKLDHFALAERNSDMLKNIYSIKGFTDSCSALLIYYGGYVPSYQERVEKLQKLKQIPKEYIEFVKKATDAKLNNGYVVRGDVNEFFAESKKWVEWTLKKIIKDYLKTNSDDWKIICKKMYQKLPYIYFNDYLQNKYLFLAQYYLNIRFFLEGLRKKEFLLKTLVWWKDVGLILGIAMMLYSFDEKKGAEKYLKKITNNTKPLREKLLKLYSVYYLQKLV